MEFTPEQQWMIDKELVRIEQMRAELPEKGMIPLPFRCWGCDRQRFDLALVTGDGLPMCVECLGFQPTEEIVYGQHH